MHNSHKPQSSAASILATALALAIGLGLGGAPPACAFTPEADAVLEDLREGMATGLAGEAAYLDFLAGLQEDDGCAAWARDPLAQAAEVWEAMVNACPALEGGDKAEADEEEMGRGRSSGSDPRARFSASQSVQPRHPGPAAPYFTGAGRNGGGGAHLSTQLSWSGNRLYDRRAVAAAGGLTLQAGHLHPDLRPTQLGFVAGSRFYAGWSGRSGFPGPLDSPQASLDGLGLAYAIGGFRFQAAGAWNRLQPRGAGILPDRRDAVFHSLGIAYRRLRIEAVHERFEPGRDRALDIYVGGAALLDPRGRWHAGGAVSRLDPGRGVGRNGAYGEVAWGSRESPSTPATVGGHTEHTGYRLEAHEASEDWSNPLQAPQGYRQDTLDGQWILPGRGEGGFSARSRLTAFEQDGYRAELESGGEAAWILGEDGLLAARTRLALIQSLYAWTYTAGTAMTGPQNRRGRARAEVQEGASGFGHILEWRGEAWRARLSLTHRGEGYRGPYPEPLALLVERREGRCRGLGAEAFTGDIRDPAGYLRMILKQEWEMGSGAILRHSLRLPWARGTGWAGDLGYQVVLAADL